MGCKPRAWLAISQPQELERPRMKTREAVSLRLTMQLDPFFAVQGAADKLYLGFVLGCQGYGKKIDSRPKVLRKAR